MAVLKNKTQKNFTMVGNQILRDKELSMKDRGVLCTLFSLPDEWKFSIRGLAALVPDGTDSIRSSLQKLEKMGYVKRSNYHGTDGKFISEIEVFAEKKLVEDMSWGISHDGKSDMVNPLRLNQCGTTDTVNATQYNNDNVKQNNNKDNAISIHQSSESVAVTEGESDANVYRKIIAYNIKLDWLYEAARLHGESEISMVTEIYELICDIVCVPREQIKIKGALYPWDIVKSRFLKIKYEHVADVLNRIIDASLGIKNMSAYLVSTLYTASLVGTIESQAELHDDYLKDLRGKPYT